ncbi:MAG TPA: putative lipid II flippase FtsW [Candidatus Polarisedimenticolia bacterium]|jgi:cell division protein FtsW|nr:putative lipid II flippase FtsW [Candidatus Polarisedimenticolia bacterium]
MSRKLAFDRTLFVIPVALSLFGVVMIYSASAVLSMQRFGSPYHYLTKQVAALVAGFVLMIGAMSFDYRRLRNRWILLGSLAGVAALLMLALLTPSGPVRRWISLGFFSFQPSELAKPVLVLFLAAFLDRRAEEINDWRRTLAPAAVAVGGIAFLIYMQPDLGTAAALCLISGLLLFLAGLNTRILLSGGALGFVALTVMIFQADYRVRRLMTFLHPSDDPLGAGFQIRQSLLSFGSGGIQGINLGEGRQKLFFLPEPHTDFIYSVIGEELGLIGTTLVLIVFALLLWRGARASLRAPDRFGYLLGMGLTLFLVVQAMLNMGMVLGLLPTKGLPLPFVSYGGSSLMVGLLSVGVLLNISQHSN